MVLGLNSNYVEAGNRLEVRRRGKYQIFVTQVESLRISKNDESGSSYSGSSRLSSRILGEFLSIKIRSR